MNKQNRASGVVGKAPTGVKTPPMKQGGQAMGVKGTMSKPKSQGYAKVKGSKN